MTSSTHTLVALLLCSGLGCSPSAADERGPSSSTTDAATTSTEAATTSPDASETSSTGTSWGESPSSSGEITPADSSSSDDGAGFITPPDGGSTAAGVCLGVRQVGSLATIHGPDAWCDPAPVQCGADPVGAWTVADHCGFEALPNFFAAQCPDSTMTVVDSAVEGTRAFGEDGSYAESLQLSIETELQLDALDCFGLQCEPFGDSLDADPSLSAACVDAEEGCVCTVVIEDTTDRVGTYDVTEQGYTITTPQGTSSPNPFCLDGDVLTVWDPLVESRVFETTSCEVAEDCADALEGEPEAEGFEWSCLY